jgi:cytochrome P450 family 110
MAPPSINTMKGPPKTSFWIRYFWSFRFIFFPLETMDARRQSYGDDYRVSQPDTKSPLVYFSSPAALEDIFTAQPEQLSAGQGNQILKVLLGEHGIVLLDGEKHRRQRQLLMPPFHGDRMRAYAQVIQDITKQATKEWSIGNIFAVRPLMQSISLQVILKTVFGLNTGSRYDKLQHFLSQMLDGFGSPIGTMFLIYPVLQQDWGVWSPWGRFLKQRQQVDELLYAEISDRRSEPDANRTDILALLLAAQDSEGQALSDEEVHDELMTILFAGHETTASALAWAMYWIAQLPDVRTKLLAEFDTLDITTDFDPVTISRIPYLSAVCQETLRLYPIAVNTFPRVVQQPIIVAGYALEPGTVIIPSIYLAHHRAQVYPKPQQFKPERFLERQFSLYEYFPFGGGDRRCIGSAFALFEMKLVLFQLLSNWDLALVNSKPIRPTRRGLTVAPSDRLRLQITGIRS